MHACHPLSLTFHTSLTTHKRTNTHHHTTDLYPYAAEACALEGFSSLGRMNMVCPIWAGYPVPENLEGSESLSRVVCLCLCLYVCVYPSPAPFALSTSCPSIIRPIRLFSLVTIMYLILSYILRQPHKQPPGSSRGRTTSSSSRRATYTGRTGPRQEGVCVVFVSCHICYEVPYPIHALPLYAPSLRSHSP